MNRLQALGFFSLGVIVTSAVAVLVGAARPDEPQVGRYQISNSDHRAFIIDTATGVVHGKKIGDDDGDWGQDFYGNKLKPAQ